MGSSPQSIQSLLHVASPEIGHVLGRARFLAGIRAALLDVLPAAIAPNLQIAAYSGYRLRLFVSNAAWATRLHYMEPALRRTCAQRLRLQVDAIDVRVRPQLAPPVSASPRPRPMSAATRAHIEQTARYVADPALAAALQRLAAAGRPE